MCSVEEDFVDSCNARIEHEEKLDSKCMKCGIENAVVRLQKKHCYCKNCFVIMVSHKFRSTLGKTKLMRHEEKVLCVFHGNQSSIALSNLIKEGADEKTHKRIIFRTVFLFVDENPLRLQETSYQELSEVFNSLRMSGFQCIVSKLSSVYDEFSFKNFDDEDISNYLLRNENDAKLAALFSEIKSNTSKIDLLRRLRYQLYFTAAKSLQCQKIFTSECGTDLSVRLLSNITLGRGSQVSYDVAVCDKRVPKIPLIRPLREITSKEIAFYNVFKNLKPTIVNPIFFMCDTASSLQEESETFIYRLQEEFPSTVYTIFHTGDKLKKQTVDDVKICQFCFNSLEMNNDEKKCQKPVILSSLKNADEKLINCSNCNCRKEDDVNLNNLSEEMCYACQRLFEDISSLKNFPTATLNKIKLQSHLNTLRKEIQDFLL